MPPPREKFWVKINDPLNPGQVLVVEDKTIYSEPDKRKKIRFKHTFDFNNNKYDYYYLDEEGKTFVKIIIQKIARGTVILLLFF